MVGACTVGVYLLAQVMFLVPGVDVTHAGAVVTGAVLMGLATAAAVVLRAPHLPSRAAMLIPLTGILAVGFLRAGTGGPTSVFTIMMALPVLSLGVEPGRLPLLLGGPVTVAALLLPVAYDPTALDGGQWIRIIFTPLILGLVCLSINEVSRRLRSRVRAVDKLRRGQAELLTAAEDHAAVLAAASALARESARELSSVIDAVTEQSIIGTDPAGRIDVFNSGARKMLRVAAHDAIGHPITRFLHPEGNLAVAGAQAPGSPFGVVVAGVRDGTPQVRDWTYLTADGTALRVAVAVTARRDAAGDLDGYLFVGTDVTRDREQARMKDEFVNLISHELRTPLSSILGYLELVIDDEDNPLTPEQLTYLGTVERNANRLLRLVSDLLFTAQVESGRFQLQEQPVDLHAVLSAAIDTAAPVAAGRDVTLKLAACVEPVIVRGDPVRLGQAVDNLISNAVKFTPTGGRVAVTLGTGDTPDPAALISVSDTGVGIPADELDRLFSRFFRASTATANAVPGVGLGLTITKAIAEAHHGSIRVASTVGDGTTFTLELPRTLDPAPPPP
ncbi:MAG TPA: ATP-binding protein [Nakamurella sp.]|nr:ATP-binding protein [Nakamurella sp.]